jgi:hypothetical protein
MPHPAGQNIGAALISLREIHALKDINLTSPPVITALIGPRAAASTLLRQ